jgi:L,D-transpeptidase ErfK/SrfK
MTFPPALKGIPPRSRGTLMLVFLCSFLPACAYRSGVKEVALPIPLPDRIETHEFSVNKEDSVVGRLATVPVKDGDALPDIARHFGLGFEEISAANPELEPWTPQPQARATLPLQFILPDAPRKGIVINLAAMRLFYFPGGKSQSVITYPAGIGKEGRSTPTGQMVVERKAAHPTWYVPESIRRDHQLKGDPLPASVSPGPDNPLGDYAMYLSRPSYLIHGTNKPYSIGFRASNGCIRLYPENIDKLFGKVPEKTPVKIVNQPYLLGWLDGTLYLQAYAPHEELDGKRTNKNLITKLKQIEKKHGRKLDWPKIEETLAQARGIPVPIFEHTDTLNGVLAKAVALQRPSRLYGQPEPPRLTEGSWYIKAAETEDEVAARRMAAMLNHQGPQIPAQAVAQDGRYQVLAGPFKDAKSTKAMAKRMKIDLEIKGQIIEPAERLSMNASTDASRSRSSRIKWEQRE